jgi:hypothetical protein
MDYTPPPFRKSGLQLVCNVKIVMENSRSCPETSTKLDIHEFGFWTAHEAEKPSKDLTRPLNNTAIINDLKIPYPRRHFQL